MTSSATTRNRLEKQGTGDNANTWGTYLNSSIDLIDAALDGRTAFSLSGSKTLTSANYAADESRERFLDITGGTGGTVTIPAVEKWYIVRNASSGDVVFTTGSGVTQTVKSGSVTLLVSDGTNIRAGVDKGYVDNAIAQAVFSAVLPEQTGNAGKYITTDGTEASWGSLAAVANSGAYSDLTGVPTALSSFTNDAGYLTSASTLTAYNLTGTIPSEVLGNSTVYVGSTAVQLNRAAASLNLTGIESIDGSAARLTTARTINGTSFNGSADITTASWGASRTLSFTGDATGSMAVNGSVNASAALTLATVNANVGTFNNVTVNGKGLVTAASNVSYLTGNQTITLSGDVTGSGATAITATLANSGVTAGTYKSVTVDAKGRVTAGTNPTTLSGYGITDAAPAASPTFTGTATFANADFLGSVRSNVTAVAGSSINCSLGNYFTKTATGALTWTVTNIPASRAYSFILELTNGGTGAQTWFSGIKWPGGTAPTLTASGVDVLGFITDDGGTTWRGVQLMKDSK